MILQIAIRGVKRKIQMCDSLAPPGNAPESPWNYQERGENGGDE
jgi:hypothetical protein